MLQYTQACAHLFLDYLFFLYMKLVPIIVLWLRFYMNRIHMCTLMKLMVSNAIEWFPLSEVCLQSKKCLTVPKKKYHNISRC